MSNKKKIYIGLGAVLLALVIFGILNNPDRKAAKIDTELEQILSEINSTMLEVRSDIVANQSCFGDESLQEGIYAECVINIRNIQDTFKNADNENLGKLEKYYQENENRLDESTRVMIENNLKLYKSNSYSELMGAYDRYFTANIEWHKFFRDVIAVRGVDSISEGDNFVRIKALAQEVTDSEENLQLKTSAFSDYLHESFDKEFVEALTNYAESLKK